MSEQVGPFNLKGYDSFRDEFYDIYPAEAHTHDTYEEAYKDAQSSMTLINEAQYAEGATELQDTLFIEDSQGHYLPYIQNLLN
jgi:hypothetical protein